MFKQDFWGSKITQNLNKKSKDTVEVQCFPLFSILLALKRTQIDYFSLDVEGSEFDVLKTIPWDQVNITVSQSLPLTVVSS